MGQAMSGLNAAIVPVIIVVVVIFVVGMGFTVIKNMMLGNPKTIRSSRHRPTSARPVDAEVENISDVLPDGPLFVKPTAIMTETERIFFNKLQIAFANRYEIFPQVPFSSLVEKTGKVPTSVWGILQNSHVDFVLAHPKYLGAVAVIELDDPSHQQATTRAKDELKNRIFADAKIPLLRYRVGEKWDPTEIRTKLDQTLGIATETNVRTTSPQRPSP